MVGEEEMCPHPEEGDMGHLPLARWRRRAIAGQKTAPEVGKQLGNEATKTSPSGDTSVEADAAMGVSVVAWRG